jgi:Domain of unknown function DUF29
VAQYDHDLHAWAIEQAALLRSRQLDQIDAISIAGELEDVAERQFDRLTDALTIVLTHMIGGDSGNAAECALREQRRHIDRVIRRNPSIKSRIDEAVKQAYQDACSRAGQPEAACPFQWETIMAG